MPSHTILNYRNKKKIRTTVNTVCELKNWNKKLNKSNYELNSHGHFEYIQYFNRKFTGKNRYRGNANKNIFL